VEGEGLKRVELSLKDLTTKFKKHTVTATLQCTGNRRDQFNDVKKVKGLEWGIGGVLLPLHANCTGLQHIFCHLCSESQNSHLMLACRCDRHR
jgi:hypothetical protein